MQRAVGYVRQSRNRDYERTVSPDVQRDARLAREAVRACDTSLKVDGPIDLQPMKALGRRQRRSALRRCSTSCSNPAEERLKFGRHRPARETIRSETGRFARFWTDQPGVRDREAPGSNPGPRPILNSKESSDAIQEAPPIR